MSGLRADGFPAEAVRARARRGPAAAFPDVEDYGHALFGAGTVSGAGTAFGASTVQERDPLDAARLTPPVFVPERLEKLIELAREPLHSDVDLRTTVGGFASALPLYVSAFGSTQVAGTGLGRAVGAQAGALGVPMVIGENVAPVNGSGRLCDDVTSGLLGRVRAYADTVPDGVGGVVIQQSTEDADAEVWNLVYSDPSARPLLDSGRLALELKVGQGAKPGLGGLTVVDSSQAARLAEQFVVEPVFDAATGRLLRCASPGTFTEEVLRQQIRLMRNNYPRARVWVKLPPGRDVGHAAGIAWAAGADAVTVDGAEGGSGWAPRAFLSGVGLPLSECLRRIGTPEGCLLVSGRMWEGTRAVKCLALGARAVGLGRAALLAADEDPEAGLTRLVECLALEMRMLVSALGKYRVDTLCGDDLWVPSEPQVPDAAPARVG
ncbi:glutamate synthase-related protein [Streptomyces sp. SGAir0957]